MTIEHKFGTTEIPAAPERVVAVGFNDQDFALAAGVEPVGARQFQGGIDITDRPWARGGRLILGVYSGISKQDYATLSKIAPTVAQSGDHIEFGMPWKEEAATIGEALGRERESTRAVRAVDERFAKARAAHPELDGRTFALAAASGGKAYVYGSQDLRARFFTSLGLKSPPAIEKLAGKSFYAPVGAEDLDLLDQDVLVIYGTPEDVEAVPTLSRLDVVREGRVVYLDAAGDFANALGFSSPLSLPYAIDKGVPQLVDALG